MSEKFNELPRASVDAIMIANARWPAFLAEHPGAVNTTIGVMIDPVENTPWQPQTVKSAREKATQEVINSGTFGYQSQTGHSEFLSAAKAQVFGKELSSQADNEILAYQSLGGTGALSLAKDILSSVIKTDKNGAIPMVLDAGWPNHPAVFSAPFSISRYDHVDSETGEYNHRGALDAFSQAPNNAVFLLQTCGYNDDGMDRSNEQWDDVFEIAKDKNAVIVLDSAYMGLVRGYESERYPIEQSVKAGLLTLVCTSKSKNMGLYNERLGALFIANAASNFGVEQVPRLDQLAARIVRRTYSNPPLVAAKAAAIALRQESYFEELEQARNRLTANRQVFGEIVKDELPAVSRGGGLFTKVSSQGFSPAQQQVLAEAGVFALPNSRINLGGIRYDQVERVGLAVLQALKTK